MIKNVSFSKLMDFEQCAYRCKLKHVDRVAEEKHPAAERGTAIHQMAEDYVNGTLKTLPTELMKFADEFEVLRREHKLKRVSLEGEWGFDKDWMPTPYKTAWLRMKGDAILFQSKTVAVAIDYNTGQAWGNEIKHSEQLLLYTIACFILYPDLEEVTTEDWYVDKDEMLQHKYTRKEALRYLQAWDKRLKKVTSAKEFPANPNQFSCRYCPFSPAKGGQCSVGYTPGQSLDTLKTYRERFG